MCSIFKYKHCVGRNFDYEVSYNEGLKIINKDEFNNHYKILGMCTGIVKDYPLLYDGMNEHGLCMGGLAFQDTAQYNKKISNKINVPSYDFILKVLGGFKTVEEFKIIYNALNITDEAFLDSMPPSDLHWFLSDYNESIVIEQTEDGFNIYDAEVMTNNPIYPMQINNYKTFGDLIGCNEYYQNPYNTRGKETEGLDGSYTSDGRFERLSWLKEKLEFSKSNFNPITQSFHLLSSVEQIYGATPVNNKFEYTIYSIVYDMKNKNAYLKNYDSLDVKKISL